MEEKTIFPREEHSDILFQKILKDPWACEKLQATFCDFLFCNDEIIPFHPKNFPKALFESHRQTEICLPFKGICQNTIFDLLRNSFSDLPYRFNAGRQTEPIIMTDENGLLLPEYDNPFYKKEYSTFQKFIMILNQIETFFWLKPIATAMITVQTI